MENMKKHDIAVDKLLEKIKKDYQKHLNKFIQELACYPQPHLAQDELFISYEIPVISTILSWVKTNIIDNNAQLFRIMINRDCSNGTAVYYVPSEDIEILMQWDFILNLETHILNANCDINKMTWLFTLNETNISNRLISIFERVICNSEEED